jgi:membrane peptidoglycan carboxypeptidase
VPSFRQLVGLGALGLLLVVAAVSVAYARTSIPSPNQLVQAQTTIVYYDNGTTEIGRFGDQNRINVRLAQVPEHVRHAVLAAEDRTFYQNRGVSPTGIVRAFWNNLRGGSTQGGSTITQQYAKNAYLSQERTYKRKAKEFFIAVKLDRRDDKDKILQDYLNTIYFGRGAYGIQTAAQTYFGKDVSKLSVAEGAVLASVIRSPAGYDPDRHPERLQGRFDYVLNGMVRQGWLSSSARTGLTVPKTVAKSQPKGGTNYFLMASVRKELRSKGFADAEIDLGGLRVVTTFNRKAQRAAVRAVRRERPTQNAKGVHIGLSAVRPGTGAVVAMYGGETAGNLNEATQARVQPGSSFKPFALTAALQDDIALRSRFWGNSPFDVPGTNQHVNNEFDTDYGSSVDLVRATQDSINTAYVDMTVQLGPKKVVDAAVAAGIPADTPGLQANAVTTLGTASVRNIDMANAYATIAAQGERADWHVVQKVTTSGGKSRYIAAPSRTRVFPRDVMADTTYALQQVVRNGTGNEARNLNRPSAGKTGTAALRPDTTTSAWYVGFTPQLSAAVDFYKGRGKADLDGVGGLSTFFGGAYPARIWTAFMQGALANTKVVDFPPPAFVGRTLNPVPTFTPSATSSSPTTTPSPPATPTTPPVPPTPAPTDAPTVANPSPSAPPAQPAQPAPPSQPGQPFRSPQPADRNGPG